MSKSFFFKFTENASAAVASPETPLGDLTALSLKSSCRLLRQLDSTPPESGIKNKHCRARRWLLAILHLPHLIVDGSTRGGLQTGAGRLSINGIRRGSPVVFNALNEAANAAAGRDGRMSLDRNGVKRVDEPNQVYWRRSFLVIS